MFKSIVRSGIAVLAASTLFLPWGAAHATGTAAGTTISNSATATYNINGVAATPVVGSVSIRVDEIIRVTVTAPATQTAVVAGEINKVLAFRVTNTGNGQEPYNLIANRTVAGDNFDPSPGAAGSLFQDTNGNGVFDAGIDLAVPLVAGVPQLTLNPDVITTIFAVSNIPAGPTNGQTGIVSLTAQSATVGAIVAGNGAAPGTILANLGTPSVGGGTVDAVVGAGPGGAADSGADDSANGTYIIAAVTVSVDKVVLNVTNPMGVTSGPCNVAIPPAGCSAFVPGSVIEYQVTVTVNGTGTAQAVTISDNVPANTTWVAASIRATTTTPAVTGLTAKTDVADGDNASCVGCGNAVGSVIANFGDIVVAGVVVVNTVTYKVTIN